MATNVERTQTDLARRMDLDKNTPSRWANGRTPVPGWASEYLSAMLAIKGLHTAFVASVRSGDRSQDTPPQED